MNSRAAIVLLIVSVLFLGAPYYAFASAMGRVSNNLGLVGYWSFEDGAGTIATDFSGHGFTGTLTNGPAWALGKHGKALNFDGTDDYVALSSDPIGTSDTITVAAWFKMNADGAAVSRGLDGFGNGWSMVLGSAAGKAVFAVITTSGGQAQYTALGTSTLQTGKWYHLAGAFLPDNYVKVYVNGVLENSSGAPQHSLRTSTVGTRIGAGNGTFFNGSLDDVRIYNRELSAAEIATLYSAGEAKINASANARGPQTGLVGVWSFDGADISGTTAYDRSANATNGTLTNGPVVTKGKLGQALSFDGTNDFISLGDPSTVDFGSGDYAFSAWIYPRSVTGGQIISKDASGGGNRQFVGIALSSGDVGTVLFFGAGGQFTWYNTTDVPISANRWQHVLVQRRGNTFDCYVNGVAHTMTKNVASSADLPQTMIATATNLTIGARVFVGAEDYFNGLIDDVRIYNRSLSAAEIVKLYKVGVAASVNASQTGRLATGLLSTWSFNGGDISGTTAYDRGTNGVNGTLTNGPVVAKGKSGQALSFDGSNDYVNLGTATNNHLSGLSAVTFSVWAKASALNGGHLVCLWDSAGGANQRVYVLGTSGTKGVLLMSRNGTNIDDSNGVFTVTNLTTGTWFNLVGTYTGSVKSIYLNGVFEASTTQPGMATATTNQLGIGACPGRSGDPLIANFSGLIDDVRIYNRVLSSAEILQLYNMSK